MTNFLMNKLNKELAWEINSYIDDGSAKQYYSDYIIPLFDQGGQQISGLIYYNNKKYKCILPCLNCGKYNSDPFEYPLEMHACLNCINSYNNGEYNKFMTITYRDYIYGKNLGKHVLGRFPTRWSQYAKMGNDNDLWYYNYRAIIPANLLKEIRNNKIHLKHINKYSQDVENYLKYATGGYYI